MFDPGSTAHQEAHKDWMERRVTQDLLARAYKHSGNIPTMDTATVNGPAVGYGILIGYFLALSLLESGFRQTIPFESQPPPTEKFTVPSEPEIPDAKA